MLARLWYAMSVVATILLIISCGGPTASEGAPDPPPGAPMSLHGPIPKGAVSPESRPKLTITDIPVDVPEELQQLIRVTFAADAVERARAAERIGKLGAAAASAVPFLIQLLSDESPVVLVEDVGLYIHVNSFASEALEAIGEPAVQPCIDALSWSGDAATRGIIFVLGASNDARAVAPLLKFSRSSDSEVRLRVIAALSGSANPDLFPVLTEALNDGNAEIRREATLSLGYIDNPRIIPPLIDALSDREDIVRRNAARALERRRDSRAVSDLLRILNNADEDPSLRFLAARALGAIAETESSDHLLVLLRDRSVPERVRIGAAEGLGLSKKARFAASLREFIKDDTQVPNVRGAAVEAIAGVEGALALSFLSELATNSNNDDHVRCCAAMEIVRLLDANVDDVRVVEALNGRYDKHFNYMDSISGSVPTDRALLRIAEHGRTDEVRVAAIAQLRARKITLPAARPK